MSEFYRTPEGAALVRERYLEVLRHWPVPSDHLRLPTHCGETFVVASGDEAAPPVVLMHGSAANSAMWMGDVASWARHFRVYAVDMIGEPGLSAQVRPPMDTDAHALWMDDVMDALGVERASFVGVSLGGWLALDYAVRRPDRVRGLALVAPGGVGRQRMPLKLILLAMCGQWGARRARAMVLGRTPDLERLPPPARAYVSFVSLTYEHFRARRTKLPIFSDVALAGLEMPMLAVLGGRDVLLDTEVARSRLETLTDAEVRWLPEAPHYIVGQTATILDFLRREARVDGV